MSKDKTKISSGDEVIFVGSKNSWKKIEDYGLLKEEEVYIVHFATQFQVSLVGIPGLHDKTLFELI